MRIAMLAAVAALAACQPLPQPFAEDRPPVGAPVLTLRDGAGIGVAPVDGAEAAAAAALAEAMAAALREAGTPAETGTGNRASFHLAGVAAPGEIRWRLAGPDGAPAGEFVQPLQTPLDSGTAPGIAARAAPRIAKLVQEDAPMLVDGGLVRLAVRPVEGAPGDGGKALTRAMATALRRANVDLAADNELEGAFIVAGSVSITKPLEKKQHVTITWELRRPGGEQIGQVNQENDVPAGALDGAWGDIAYAVASGATDGIVALIEKVKTAATRS